MLSKDLKKAPWLIITLILFSISIFCFPTLHHNSVRAEPSIKKNLSSVEESHPLIVYYSRSGKTRMVANILMDQLSCEIGEIKSTRKRTGFGIITCVLDQLFNRDDQIEPLKKDVKRFNPIIIASPIWLGKLSSPARTFIKQAGLQGKEVYVFLTYNGNLSKEEENILKKEISTQGFKLKGLYKIITKDVTEKEIKKEISVQWDRKSFLKKKVNNL